MIYVVMGEEKYRDGGQPLAWARSEYIAKIFMENHKRENQKWYIEGMPDGKNLMTWDEFQENPIYEEHNKSKLASPLYWENYWIVEVEEA